MGSMSEDDLKNLRELESKNKPRVLTMYFEDGGETSVVPYDDYESLQQENHQLKSQLEQSKNETKQRDDVIDECKKHCTQEISASTVQYERRKRQQDLVYKVAHERILKILNKRGGTDE